MEYIFVVKSMLSGVRLPGFKYQLWFVHLYDAMLKFSPLQNGGNRKTFLCEFDFFKFHM